MFGPDQPVILHLLEVEPAMKTLQGVVMELLDCTFPLLEVRVMWAPFTHPPPTHARAQVHRTCCTPLAAWRLSARSANVLLACGALAGLLLGVVATSDLKEGFDSVEADLLDGAKPRGPSM
jgi:hypothetical protein